MLGCKGISGSGVSLNCNLKFSTNTYCVLLLWDNVVYAGALWFLTFLYPLGLHTNNNLMSLSTALD